MRRLACLALAGWLAAVICPDPASAQLRGNRRDPSIYGSEQLQLNNPGRRGPSSALGGRYTGNFRALSESRMLGMGNDYSMSLQPRTGPGLGSSAFGNMDLSMSAVYAGPVRSARRMGGRNISDARGGAGLDGRPSTAAIQAVSGLARMMSLDYPLAGAEINQLPLLQGSGESLAPDLPPFNAAFGLMPAEPEPSEASEGESPSLVKLMDQRLDRRRAELLADAFVAFREATTSDAAAAPPDKRGQRISEARRALELASDVNPMNAEPLILLAHLALLQERQQTAARALLDAAMRDADVFLQDADLRALVEYLAKPQKRQDAAERGADVVVEDADRRGDRSDGATSAPVAPGTEGAQAATGKPKSLGERFGDYDDAPRAPDRQPRRSGSALLDRQLDQYLRAIEFNEKSFAASVVSAYCAWRLGDLQRVERVLTKVETAVQEDYGVLNPEFRRFATILRAARPEPPAAQR